MTTLVAPISKDQMSELIFSDDGSKMDKDEAEALYRFAKASVCLYAGKIEDKIICVWGLIPPTLLSDQAYLWLQTTPAAEEHQFILVRRGQIEMKKMLEEYPRIVGHCEIGATQSIRWLRWMGAKFGEPEGDLLPFTIKRQGA